MNQTTKTYQATIWTEGPEKPGKRVSVTADSITDAKRKLEADYGVGNIYDLHNEEDAAKPR
jgi:hypothetical protein